MSGSELFDRIESVPGVMLGKPVFRGTRIPVYVVLDLLDAGVRPDEIVDDYPVLTLDDVAAAIEFRNRSDANVTIRSL